MPMLQTRSVRARALSRGRKLCWLHKLEACVPSIPSGALEQRLPPQLVLDVPLNGFVESILKIAPRFPVQLTLCKRGIDCIAAIVSQPVGHKRNQAVRLAQFIENHFYNIDIHHLAVTSEIINRSRFSLEERGDNREIGRAS